MSETSPEYSMKVSEDRLVVSKRFCQPSAPPESSGSGAGMLSVDFSTPLAGQARSERIKQMAKNHPAFEKSRATQEILVKIQQSLRRMPGISATQANEVVRELQEVGQIVSQETSHLVNAVMNLNLDQDDTDKAIARMSIEANILKAKADDQSQTITDLRDELAAEKSKHEQAERYIRKIMDELKDLSAESKKLKTNGYQNDHKDEGPSAERQTTIKSLEETIKLLEDQVNNRRSLWLMKHSDHHSVARAIETLADSVLDNQAAHKSIMALKPLVIAAANDDAPDSRTQNSGSMDQSLTRGYIDSYSPSSQPTPSFQPISGPSTTGPPKFGHQTGRSTSAFANDRRYPGTWNLNGKSAHGRFGAPNSNINGAAFASSSFGRAPSRKSLHAPSSSRYRHLPNDLQHSGYGFAPELVPSKMGAGSSFDSAFSHGQDLLPQTPTANRGRHSRLLDGPPAAVPPSSSDFVANGSTVAVGRGASSGPLIHLSERSVNAWHEQIMEFYGVIRSFVEQYANMPENAMSIKSGAAPLWPILIATYHPLSEREASSYLDLHLKSENSKSCLVTRVIIDYIVNRVWVPNAWTGADRESTTALVDLEHELDKTAGHPSAVRQPLIDQQAAIVDTIMKNEQDTSFYKGKLEEITGTLLTNLQPLLNRYASPSDAYRDLGRVAENAWELSSKILTSRLTFDFRFPEIGSRFSSQSMLPIWPHMDPLELQAKHWRVAMVTTPVITCRNDTGSNISAHSVAMADVFCMQ